MIERKIKHVYFEELTRMIKDKKMSNYLFPKEFIQKIYIDNIGEIINKHKYFYISFGLLGTGIEFLGKCLNEQENPLWHCHTSGLPKRNFDFTLTQVMPKYAPFKDKYKLCDSLRNGMAHAFQPKNKIELTNKEEANNRGWKNLELNSNQRLVLISEELYADFKIACIEVIHRVENKKFDLGGKMYQPFLEV